jgi:hypothetical protein
MRISPRTRSISSDSSLIVVNRIVGSSARTGARVDADEDASADFGAIMPWLMLELSVDWKIRPDIVPQCLFSCKNWQMIDCLWRFLAKKIEIFVGRERVV